jgi:inosine-uridine nucleoside N-ribohydrolase
MNRTRTLLLMTLGLVLCSGPDWQSGLRAEPKQTKIPILLDLDIGDDIDDVFALATVLASPELDLRGVTTVGEDAHKRAQITSRFLTAVGSPKISVAAGLPEKTSKPLPYWQVQYGNHASVYFRDPKPVKQRAPEFLYKKIKDQPGELTLVALGPLTNIARLFEDHPDCKTMIKRIVLMGGSLRRGYEDKSTAEAEYNIVQDVKAAQVVFRSGVPLVVAPLDATAMVRLDPVRQKRLFDKGSLLTLSVQALVQLWQDKKEPTLCDPVAVTLCFTEKFCKMEDLHLEVDDKGFTKIGTGKPNARVATSIKTDEYLDWLVDRLVSAYPPSLPSGRTVNVTKLVPRGMMPNRVHAFEDFETDIEKRWWLSGRIETVNVPPGSKRALRGVLTQDFDDRQGETKTLYTAIVFNPVPGPPMGKKPHIGFRYWLKGTDTMRVQLYSLTNGYHRCLTVKGLPQGQWQEGAVDMRKARKPDGKGGPLAEDERIDDIQFYVDPRAELLIDDIVLYDAALPDEKRPFPKRFLFTGLFDTGKQGKEWPGSFTIAPKQGYFWNAARSVAHPTLNVPWIQLDLRGERPIGDATHLFFRYKLEDADTLKVSLASPKLKTPVTTMLKDLKQGEWAEATIDWDAVAPGSLRNGDSVREIQFVLPAGAQLLIDDVLLYEPGKR